MKRTIIMAAIAALAATPALAQDRAQENRAAVRRMFPIVSMFDKRAPKADATAPTTGTATTETRGGRAVDAYGGSPADVARIRAMDVAGVRLGMTPEEAATALRAAGYAPAPRASYDRRLQTTEGYAYDKQVRSAAEQRTGRFTTDLRPPMVIVSETWSKAADDQSVAVSYAVLREGRRVQDVLYRIPEGRTSWTAMRDAIVAKYGRPTRLSESIREIAYCGDGACAPLMNGRFASLKLYNSYWLQLSDDGAGERAAAKQIAADAEASITKAKPAF